MQVENRNMGEFINIDSSTIALPRYQRRYAWGDDTDVLEGFISQFEDFFNRLSDGDVRPVFFGSIIEAHRGISLRTNIKFIVDGQQRITTMFLLYCSLYDLLTKYIKSEEAEGDLDRRVLDHLKDDLGNFRKAVQYFDRMTQRYKLKLELQVSDNEALTKICNIVFQEADESSNPSKGSGINRAYTYIHKRIKELNIIGKYVDFLSASYEDRVDVPYKGLLAFPDTLLVTHVCLEQPDDENAMFRNINQYNVPLSETDLVKNFLFMKLRSEGSGVDSFYQKWSEEFGKDFWKNNELDHFKAWFAHTEKSNKISGDIVPAYEGRYGDGTSAEILSVLEDIYSSLKTMRKHIEATEKSYAYDYINTVAAGRKSWAWYAPVYVIDTAISSKVISEEEAASILELVKTYEVRRILSGKKHTRQKDVGIKISKILNLGISEGKNTKDRLKKITQMLATDTEILQSLSAANAYREVGWSVNDTSFLKMVFQELVDKKRNYKKGSSEELDFSNMTIEHIAPQNEKNPWDLTMPKDRNLTDVINTLGNLSLLLKGANSTASDSSFEAKKKTLSGLYDTYFPSIILRRY